MLFRNSFILTLCVLCACMNVVQTEWWAGESAAVHSAGYWCQCGCLVISITAHWETHEAGVMSSCTAYQQARSWAVAADAKVTWHTLTPLTLFIMSGAMKCSSVAFEPLNTVYHLQSCLSGYLWRTFTWILSLPSTLVTICTAEFKVQITAFAHRGYLCVSYSWNERQQFPWTAFVNWFL